MTHRVTRRELGGLVGSAFLFAACGGSTSAGSRANGPAPAGTSGGGSLPPVTLRGAVVPAGEQISVADATRYSRLLNGAWRGGWHDSLGRSGTSDVSARINPGTRTATMDISCSGELLNAPVSPERYTIDLAGYRRVAPHWHVVSPQLGDVVLSAGSGTDFTASVTSLPQSSIHSIDIQATRVGGGRVDLSYQLNGTGKPVLGTMAWAKNGARATPAPIGQTTDASPANIQSGSYAAGLLSAADISEAVGRPFAAPIANGGRLLYDTGVNVSNGRAMSTDKKVDVSYSVYVCDSRAHANAFWQKESSLGLPAVPGPWRAGFFLTSVPTMYAFDGRYVTTLEVQSLRGPQLPQLRAAAIALTKTLINNLNR